MIVVNARDRLSFDANVQSPDGSSSLPSLCSPNSSNPEDEFAFMSTSLDNDDIDLSMRAPYIPMNENDDLPLLTEDLMWSAFSDDLSLHKDIKQQNAASNGTGCVGNIAINSIANLLASDAANNCRTGKTSSLAVLLSAPDDDKQVLHKVDSVRSSTNNNQNIGGNPIENCNGNSNKSRMHAINEMAHSKLQQTNAKDANSKFACRTSIIDDASKMEVVDSVDGSIATYTIEMLDDDAYSKNCK